MHTPHNNNHAECRDEMHGSRTRCFDQALVCPSSDPRTSQSIHCIVGDGVGDFTFQKKLNRVPLPARAINVR